MDKFGWCFIGAGSIANKVAKELLKGDNNKIVSVWNRTYSKAEMFAKEFHATAYKNVEEAINDPKVEGVYIAITNDQHYEYMQLCIKHHKHILCEKPFTMDKKQAEEIFRLAKVEGVYVSEAMWTWHNKTANKVKEWVSDNKVGKIKKVKCKFGFPALIKKHYATRLKDRNLLGGCLLDLGVYGLRYTLELFGMPKEIECKGHLKGGVDMNERVIFIYDDFIVKHHFSINSLVGESYSIKGDKGKIKVPFFHFAKKAYLVGSNKEQFIDDSFLYDRQFINVSKEIDKGLLTSEFVKKDTTIKCMELMDICRRQMGVIYPSEE